MDDWRSIGDLAVGVLLQVALKAMESAGSSQCGAHPRGCGEVITSTYRIIGSPEGGQVAEGNGTAGPVIRGAQMDQPPTQGQTCPLRYEYVFWNRQPGSALIAPPPPMPGCLFEDTHSSAPIRANEPASLIGLIAEGAGEGAEDEGSGLANGADGFVDGKVGGHLSEIPNITGDIEHPEPTAFLKNGRAPLPLSDNGAGNSEMDWTTTLKAEAADDSVRRRPNVRRYVRRSWLVAAGIVN